LTAIDFAEHAVNMTKYRLEQCGLPADVRQASALNLPFEDNSFDLLFVGRSHAYRRHPEGPRRSVSRTRPWGRGDCDALS
jgi:ubiquinone/menaquinone biosynthesis C-methylase UbiE